MSWVVSLIKILPTLVEVGGSVVVPLLIMGGIFYVYHTRVVKKMSNGECKGNTSVCRFNSFKENRKMWIAKFNALISGVKADFMSDFVESNDVNHHIKSVEIGRLVQRHGNLIDSCFLKFFINTEDIMVNNHLPNPYKESSAESFESLLRDYFNEDWDALWEKHNNEYDHKVFYLSLQSRIDKNERDREKWFQAYFKMFKKVYKNNAGLE